MRKHTGIFFALLAVAVLGTASAAAAPVAVSVSVFHDQLAPHGRWVVAGSYGNCWVPSGVAAGWVPYVNGQWVYSDYGWTWVSDDPWGDIPYHYGTWALADPYGWVWVPGTVWAPAWVTWAYTDDYVGWAPVPPSFALSATGYFGSPVVVTSTHYVFVPTRQFVGVPVATVRIPAQQSVTILPHAVKTTRFDVSQGVVRVAGPPETRVAAVVGHPIQHVAVNSLRAQPTTLAAGGVTATKSQSVRVVAPATERAKIAATSAAPAKTGKAQAETKQAQTRAAEKTEKNPKKPARPAPESTVRNESSTSHAAHATHQAQPKPKARPETETRQANVAHTQAAPKPKAKPKPEHRAEPEKPQPTAQGEKSEKAQPEPEARPQTETRQANAEHSQPAPKPKAKPQQKPPQPAKEKERPPSQD
jgi:hypothetical protein